MAEDRARAAGPARLTTTGRPAGTSDPSGVARAAVVVEEYDDPRLHDYRDLTDVALRTKVEQPAGLFIAEGALVITRALRAGCRPRSLLMSPEWLDRMDALVAEVTATGAPVYAAPVEVLERLTGFHVHRGALAAFHRPPERTVEEVSGPATRLVVVEDAVNHTNVGAVFRTAAALGMDGVVLSPSSADPLYRRSVRVSMGEVFAVPWARAGTWPEPLRQLAAEGWTVAALTPATAAVPIDELSPARDERVALVLGTEGPGLSARALAACTVAVRIPMAAGVDSLNLGAAAAIACWELGRR